MSVFCVFKLRVYVVFLSSLVLLFFFQFVNVLVIFMVWNFLKQSVRIRGFFVLFFFFHLTAFTAVGRFDVFRKAYSETS